MFYTLRRWVLVRKRLHKLRAGVNFFFFSLGARREEKVQGEQGRRKEGGDVLERQTLHTNPTSSVL